MMQNIPLSKIRTDLVVDKLLGQETDGLHKKTYTYGNIQATELEVGEEMASVIEKKKGRYVTIEFTDHLSEEDKKNLVYVLSVELKKLLTKCGIHKEDKAFIVGLGNRMSTPDSLGPKTLDHIFVTKYLFDLGTKVDKGIRNVSAFAPGVLGTTGMESSEMILGIIKEVKPDFLIAIDALASSSIDRINKTIQMTDTGIHPGSGVGNERKEISQDTIGIPVIAIGIPTVVDAVTIVSDTIHYLLKQVSYNKQNMKSWKHKMVPVTARNYKDHETKLSEEEKERILGMVGTLSEEEVTSFIFEVLTPIGYNMMVTPKEVDFTIEQLSDILSHGINHALHEKDVTKPS